MNKNNYNVIGVMSGTSLDGIDLAYVSFDKREKWSYKMISAETVPYSEEWKELLREAVLYKNEKLEELNRNYTFLLAEVILKFIQKHDINLVDAICSHGHTIKHEPENGYTLQIGNLPELADKTAKTVVCDFRVQDVDLGGQGAPLVPIGDELLFAGYDYCLNLGGFGNISVRSNNIRIAYDICAVNTVLNYLASRMSLEYDHNGEIAASGNINEELLKKLDALEFYKKAAPKSLGIEWVHHNIVPLINDLVDVASVLHTYTIHAAIQIASELKESSEAKVLVTGGGTFNKFLLKEIAARTSVEIVVPSTDVVNYKEALIFAFLGILRLRKEINVLSSVTGASKNHSSGVIFQPKQNKEVILPTAY